MLQVVGPAARGSAGNHQTVTLEDAFDGGSQLVHTGDFVLENSYDGFDRVIEVTDAAGNVVDTDGTLGDPCYDPGGRLIKTTSQGPIGGTTPTNRSGTGNVDLAEAVTRYDEAGRAYENQQSVFVANTTGSGPLPAARDITHSGGGLAANSVANDHTAVATIYNTGGANGDSYVLSRTVYDRAGRAVETIADNTAVTTSEYDGASRRIRQVDPLDNEALFTYDANSNVVVSRSLERSTIEDPETAVEEFITAHRYDSLNRLVATAVSNPAGEAS